MKRILNFHNISQSNKANYLIYAIILFLLPLLLALIIVYMQTALPEEPLPLKTTIGAKAVWQFSINSYREKTEQSLDFPYDTAIDRKGNIYVTDSGSGKIIIYNQEGNFLSLYDGHSKKTLHTPLGISINDKGNIAVADKRLSAVIIFDKNFKLLQKLPEIFPIKPQFNEDKLYVTTFQHISEYSDDGKLLNKIGTRGKQWEQFDFPNGIAITKNFIYVSDSNNYRIQALDKKTFSALWVEGEPAKSPDDINRRFDLPAGLAVDNDSYLYLVDTFDCSIRLLNKHGYEIATIGDFGIEEGLFKYPTSITYAGNNRFLIVDRGNNRVQAIDIFAPKPGVRNTANNAKVSIFILFVPFLAYKGLILGFVAFLVLAATFLVVSKHIKLKNRPDEEL